MATFTYDQYARELSRDLTLVGRAVEVIRRTVKLRGPRAVQAEIEAVTPRRPVDRGTYRRSFRFDAIPNGAVAYNFAPYAPIIELGRRPGAKMPPIDPIIEWVKRKGIGRQQGPVGSRESMIGPGKGRSGPKQLVRRAISPAKLSDRAARGIAFVIARAIARRGMPAHMIIARAAEVIDGHVHAELQRELAKEQRA
jgi:hypothetical protein